MTNLAKMNIAPGAHRRIPGPGLYGNLKFNVKPGPGHHPGHSNLTRKSRREIERHWQLGLAVILATAASWRIARSTVT